MLKYNGDSFMLDRPKTNSGLTSSLESSDIPQKKSAPKEYEGVIGSYGKFNFFYAGKLPPTGSRVDIIPGNDFEFKGDNPDRQYTGEIRENSMTRYYYGQVPKGTGLAYMVVR